MMGPPSFSVHCNLAIMLLTMKARHPDDMVPPELPFFQRHEVSLAPAGRGITVPGF